MRHGWLLISALLATTLHAAPPPGEKPKETGAMIGDAVTQPLSDANLKHREIPKELLAIKDDPYALKGIKTCRICVLGWQVANTRPVYSGVRPMPVNNNIPVSKIIFLIMALCKYTSRNNKVHYCKHKYVY